MRHKVFILPVALILLLVSGAAGVYAYDASRDDMIAEGVSVGGVDVGGMRASAARVKLERELAAPLARPLTVSVRRREFTLPPERARIHADVEGMVQEALAVSREGNVLSRTVRNLTGGEVDESLSARVTYSRTAVTALVRRIKRRVDRRPRDASVSFSVSGLRKVPSADGLAVRGRELTRAIQAELVEPRADRVVDAHTKVTKPKVTTGELTSRFPYAIVINRGAFQLRFYKALDLRKTYPIAVGQVGLETPAGLYHVQNKAVNPAWHVPNSPWAGDLAGTVIPGGVPENPIKARWMGIYNGAGIHGTDAVYSLGTAASHGCIRMAIPDVMELYDQVPVQTPVYIG